MLKMNIVKLNANAEQGSIACSIMVASMLSVLFSRGDLNVTEVLAR